MKKLRLKNYINALAVILATAIFAFSFFYARTSTYAHAEGEESVSFDLLEGAIFDDDASKRLTYDTFSRTGTVSASVTPWLNRDFSFVEYEKVKTPDGEKPFNECTTVFSVTYSNITLFDTTSILGVAITADGVRKDYRVYGELKSGQSALITLGQGETTPFDSPDKADSGNWRAGKVCLGLTEGSKTTITATVTPKIGETNGSISFTINGEDGGTIVYKSATQPTMGLVCSRATATISDASYKVLGATGWVTPPPPPSYSGFDGEQVNSAFGYKSATNTGSLQATSAEITKPFGNLSEYKSVTLIDGTKTTVEEIVWEYEATFTAFNYVNGKDKEEPENYYGTGLSLMTSDGVSLNMRIMYDGRLNIAASNATLFGLGGYGKNFNLYGFCPKDNPEDVNKDITLKYRVDRKTNKIAYYVNGVEFGEITYIGKAELNQFGLHSYFGGGKYKDFSLRLMDVASVEKPPVYEVFNGQQLNDTFNYDGKTNTAHLDADKRNYTKSFGGVPIYKSLTLSDGAKVKSSDVVWEYEATLSNFTFGDSPLDYFGVGISIMTDDGLSLDMRIMYDGRLYVCAVPNTQAANFGLSANGKIIDIPDFNPKANPEDAKKEIVLKFKVDRATGAISYYVDGSLYGSVTYFGDSAINRFALHSWWGGGDYKDFSLRALDVVDVEVRDYFTEDYVSNNPYDKPSAEPNLEKIEQPEQGKESSCKSQISTSGLYGLLILCGGKLLLTVRRKRGEN